MHMKLDYDRLNYEAIKLRRRFEINEYAPIDLDSILVVKNEITYLSFPMSDNMCAICVKDEKNKVIAINSIHTIGRQRFSLAHEFYHLYIQDNFKFSICTTEKRPIEEKKADAFASYFLLPRNTLLWFIENELETNLSNLHSKISLENIIKIEQYFKISHTALLVRLKLEKIISETQYATFIDSNIKTKALSFGYDNALYLPSQNENYSTGRYIKLLETLKKNSIINFREYEEYLLDIGRALN